MAKEKEEKEEGKIHRLGDFLKTNIEKGEMALKHAMGLGEVPNSVPVTEPKVDCQPRDVDVGWHPVGGVAGKWFAEETGLGKMITERINRYPDPTQHWAVLVGDYAHQLWMDENFDVIYTNEKVKREEWQTFKVGETKFNDDAVRRAGETVIASTRAKQPAYNLITNNCQTYALQLLDAVKVGGHKDFGTTLAVYERLLGPGKVMDLFDDGGQQGTNDVGYAQQVMDENTTQLNPEEEQAKRDDRKNGWSGNGEGKEQEKEGKRERLKKWKWESGDDEEERLGKKGREKRDRKREEERRKEEERVRKEEEERERKRKSEEKEKEKGDVKDKVLSFFGKK